MGQFLEACGATGPLALVVESTTGADVGKWTIPQPFALIGREVKAELTLDGEAVSQRHAYVQVVGGRVFCVDLGSRVGITWGQATEPSGWLALGQAIGVGPYQIRLDGGVPDHANDAPAPNPLAASTLAEPDAEPLSAMVLEVPRRSEGPTRWRVQRVLTLLGRGSDCRLKIHDSSISRFHCALIRTPGGTWVVDLLSREGVRVNGARVRWAPLNDGDHLHVGRYRLIVRQGDSATASSGSGSGAEHAAFPPLPRDQFPAILSGVAPPARTAAEGQLRQVLKDRPPEQVEFAEALMAPLVQQFGQMQQQMFDQFHQATMAMFQMFGSMHRDQMATVREELERIRQLGQELQTLQAQQSRADQSETSRPAKPARENSIPGPAPSRKDQPPEAAEIPDRPAPKRHPLPTSAEQPGDVHARLAQRMAEIQSERQNRWQRLVTLMTGNNMPSA